MGLFRRASRAQGYAEFGISIAVVALVAMLGLDQVRAVIYTYFTSSGMTQSLNPPTPTPGIAPTNTKTIINCPGTLWDVNVQVICTVTVTINGNPASGTVLLTTSAQGSSSQGLGTINTSTNNGQVNVPCGLSSGGTCTFAYLAGPGNYSGSPFSVIPSYAVNMHTLTALYTPGTPWVQSQGQTLNVPVRRQAALRSGYQICTPNPVSVGETAKCTVFVDDTDWGTTQPPDGGEIIWDHDPSSTWYGTLSPGPTCTLTNGSCSVWYTATTSGTTNFKVTYRDLTSSDPYHTAFPTGFPGAGSITSIPPP